MLTVKKFVMLRNGHQIEVDLPATRIVCPTCNGKGSHVNPSIDGNGIDPQEFVEDPEFAENYFSGLYDVQCQECRGRNVVEIVDTEQLSVKMRKRYQRQLDCERADRAEAAAEERWGA